MELLYVDDEPFLLELGKEFLEMEPDVNVTTLNNPIEALALLNDTQFDVIVSDYMMPELNGLEFFKRVRITGNETPFILFTGKGREEVVIEAMRYGVDFYIKKGGDAKSQFAELVNAIRQCTARREAEVALEHNAHRFRTMIENQSEIITLAQLDGTVTFISNSVRRVLGYEPEEVVGKKVMTFFEDPSLFESIPSAELLLQIPDMSFKLEAGIRHRDSTVRYLEMSGRILTKDGVPDEVIVNAHDVTGRKADEKRIEHLINVLKAIRDVNKQITSEKDPKTLLQSVCDIAVSRGYSTAWSYLFENERNPALLVESGVGEVFDDVRAEIQSGEHLQCTKQMTSGKAIFVAIDGPAECAGCYLNQYPHNHVHVAKPLTYNGKIFGQLSVTLPTELFSPEELSVLGEIAEDLSYALYHLDLGREKEEYQLGKAKMRTLFHDRFTQMKRPTFIADRKIAKDVSGYRLMVGGSSDAFLNLMGYDSSISGMELGVLAQSVSEGTELVQIVDEVIRSKIPQSMAVRSARDGAEYMAFIFAPGADYAGVMLIPSLKAERSICIGRCAEQE
jgi:PAS domain S-box-containing protein